MQDQEAPEECLRFLEKFLIVGGGREIKIYKKIERSANLVKGRESQIKYGKFSEDFKTLILLEDNAIKIIILDYNSVIAELKENSKFRCFDVCNRTKWIVSGNDDLSIKVWSFTEKDLKFTVENLESLLTCIAFGSHSWYIVSGHLNGVVNFWHLGENYMEKAFGYDLHKGPVENIVLSNYGKYVASSSKDKSLVIWDIKDRKEKYVFPKNEEEIKCITFSHNDEYIAYGLANGEIYIRELNYGGLKFLLKSGKNSITNLIFNINNNYIISSDSKGYIKVWDLNLKKVVKTIRKSKYEVVYMSLNREDRHLYVLYGNKSVKKINFGDLKIRGGI